MSEASTRDEEEARYLTRTLRALDAELERARALIDGTVSAMEEQKEYLWEHRRDMDGSEKAALRAIVDVAVGQGEHAVQTRDRLERLRSSPYFGRVDFSQAGATDSRSFYIGVHGFREPQARDLLVHDWRAPVSSLYYDFESGPAHFPAPEGTAHGEITGKRQYKISDGRLEFMFESALNIGDDVLQRELSQSTDDRMRNIVATIQREQNAVIRNETAEVLILQGVAGSGKTSIALHRVAFLLYRFKDTLSSDDVMILSPNRIFGDYIANVLPELGEERIAEIDVDGIAARFLGKVTDYQSFSEQVVALLDHPDPDSAERIRFKATPQFVDALDEWVRTRAAEEFASAPIHQRGEQLPAEWVADTFGALGNLPVFTRLERLADAAIGVLKQEAVQRHVKWAAADSTSVRKQVAAMFPYSDPFALYRGFYRDPAREGLYRPLGKRKIEFADVFPLIYTMLRASRHEGYGRIRHLLVDEMQDYTPVQYAVLRALFSCKMTILGDSNQSVNPFSSSSLESIRAIFPEADCLELRRSYRSTTEITDFAQNISRNDKLIPVERRGVAPRVLASPDREGEIAQIVELIRVHERSDHRSLGIITKTVAQAQNLHAQLSSAGIAVTLLDYESAAFSAGIVVTSAHISKGLEFDRVIVPHTDAETYRTDMDRSMLYIACTRAMHQLDLTHCGARTSFLAFAKAVS